MAGSRGLTSNLLAEFSAKKLRPAFFVRAQFVSGWIYLWSGLGAIDWNGHTWTGIALPNGEMLGMISQLVEGTDLQAQGIALALGGIPASSMQQVLNECRPSFGVYIYIGAMADDGSIVPSPICAWAGRMDIPTINESGETMTVVISVETVLVDLQRPREWRYTDQDQQLFSPGDLGFQFVGALQDFQVNWGNGAPVAPIANVPIKVGP